MPIHADLTTRAVSFADEARWVRSPAAGIDRRMLESDGDERGRVTSVVRYRPGSRLPYCEHAQGEEILVLDGDFADERGEYPAGTYLRNPPGSGHAPWSEGGCVLFVKLGQFHLGDRESIVTDVRGAEWFPGLHRGIAVLPLHGFGSERVTRARRRRGRRRRPLRSRLVAAQSARQHPPAVQPGWLPVVCEDRPPARRRGLSGPERRRLTADHPRSHCGVGKAHRSM